MRPFIKKRTIFVKVVSQGEMSFVAISEAKTKTYRVCEKPMTVCED